MASVNKYCTVTEMRNFQKMDFTQNPNDFSALFVKKKLQNFKKWIFPKSISTFLQINRQIAQAKSKHHVSLKEISTSESAAWFSKKRICLRPYFISKYRA